MYHSRRIILAISNDPNRPAIKNVDSYSIREINAMADDLAAYGIKVYLKEKDAGSGSSVVFLVIDYDTEELKVIKGHRAGRRAKDIPLDSPLYYLTVARAIDWLDEHTVAEGMDAFGGVSRAVYYRRKKYLIQFRDEEPDTPVGLLNWR